jgi:hypothetical protein
MGCLHEHAGMGIRYYAWPVPEEAVQAARLYPTAFMAADPFGEAWFTKNEGNCYLDKAWRDLQWLLGAEGASTATGRPAAALVRGQVTMTSQGWIAHVGVLDPNEVREASEDLDAAMPGLIRELSGSQDGDEPGDPGDADYVRHYLEVLRGFAAEQARAGRGMVYMIG